MSAAVDYVPQLLTGRVMHRRLQPVAHELDYSVFMLRLPLSRLDRLHGSGLAVNRFGWVAFDERDHGRRDGSPLVAWIRGILERERIDAAGEIELICFPRMLGYAFKPISFWLCHDAAGAVRAVLAEVRNTFGEGHNYLLANADGSALRDGQTLTARKVFHVSPFLEVKGEYAFRFHFSTGRFLAHIDYADETGTVLVTSVGGRSAPLTRRSLAAAAIKFPAQSLATVLRIHWNALRLWLKAVPYFSKPIERKTS